MSAARELANFLVGVTAAELPPQALDHAAMLVASTIASAAMGSGLESARIVKDMACSLGGSPRASVWFDGGPKGADRLPVVAAAQVNAVMSDAAASDDSDLRTIVHCGTPLVATALAAAEHHGGTGEDVLAAIVVGYEAAGRIIDAMTGFRERGRYQRRPRIPCRNGDDERDTGGARSAARLQGRGAHPRHEARVLRGV